MGDIREKSAAVPRLRDVSSGQTRLRLRLPLSALTRVLLLLEAGRLARQVSLYLCDLSLQTVSITCPAET